MKYAWTALITMSVIGIAGHRVQSHAEGCEFAVTTAQLVAPQVRAHAADDLRRGDKLAAKGEWAWFVKAHTGLTAAMNRGDD